LLLYSSKPSLGVFQLAGHFTSSTNANKLSGTIITAPSVLPKENHQSSMVSESASGTTSLETQTMGKAPQSPSSKKTKLCDRCGCYTHPTNKCVLVPP
jgi:hypothetical protein